MMRGTHVDTCLLQCLYAVGYGLGYVAVTVSGILFVTMAVMGPFFIYQILTGTENTVLEPLDLIGMTGAILYVAVAGMCLVTILLENQVVWWKKPGPAWGRYLAMLLRIVMALAWLIIGSYWFRCERIAEPPLCAASFSFGLIGLLFLLIVHFVGTLTYDTCFWCNIREKAHGQ